MDYKRRIKLLKFIGDTTSTSNESRKYVYALMNNSPDSKLVSRQLSTNIIKIEEKHNNSVAGTKIYSQLNLEVLLEAISACNNKEEDSNLIKIIMSLVLEESKDIVFDKHKITAVEKGFQIESSKGLFGKKSHNLTPAMLEYIISNGEIKKNSDGKIPLNVTDSLIESTLEFNSSNNSHDKFLKICGKTSIQSAEDMEAELEKSYNIKNKIPKYVTNLAYDISIGNIVIARNDQLILSYKSKDNSFIRANVDLWDYKPCLNSLLRGESIVDVISSFSQSIVKKV